MAGTAVKQRGRTEPRRQTRPPKVWLLSQGRRGDLEQMQALLQALAWPGEIKTLHFRPPPIPALAPLLLRPHAGDRIAPPWPDLIVCAEAMSSVIAQRLRRLSGGRTKLICLGRPAGDPAVFDLVLTTAQYHLPPQPNVVELSLPLTAAPEKPDDDAVRLTGARPFIAVLVGGASSPEVLDRAAARELADAVCRYAAHHGGTLHVVTSPRTGRKASDELLRRVPPPHRVHVYGRSPNNPYRRVLALADEIIVTNDSVSMVADALATEKPVYVYALPRTRNPTFLVSEWCRRNVLESASVPPLLRPVAWLFEKGFVETSADRLRLFGRLAGERRIGWFGGPPPLIRKHAGLQDMEIAVARVKNLFRKAG